MYEVTCPSCEQITRILESDHVHICRECHSAFRLNFDKGVKQVIQDHFYLKAHFDLEQTEKNFISFLEKSFLPLFKKTFKIRILKKELVYIPFWVIHLEAQTRWKGLVKKAQPKWVLPSGQISYVKDSGSFSKIYSWCIPAREQITDFWGLDRLNQDNLEKVPVRWTGCELYQLVQTKYNRLTCEGPPPDPYFQYLKHLAQDYTGTILSVQVFEKEAVRLAKDHVKDYHRGIVDLKSDVVTSCETVTDVVGVLLLHIPFVQIVYEVPKWFRWGGQDASVVIRRVLISPVTSEILKIEWPDLVEERLSINRVIGSLTLLIFGLLGWFWTFWCWIPGFFCVFVWWSIEMKMKIFMKRLIHPYQYAFDQKPAPSLAHTEWPI